MVEPIPALARLPAVRTAVQSPLDRMSPPQASQTLRLVLSADSAGTLLGRSEHGQIYQLFAPGAPTGWHAGQTLVVQVLRTGPPLEVRVLGSVSEDSWPQPGAGGAYDDTPALRPDQAKILRLQAASTDAMAQAAHWRQLVVTALRKLVLPESGPPLLLPQPPQQAQGDAALLLRLVPWHGWPLALWIEQRRWVGGAPNRRARRRPSTRLCLGLNLPSWGPIGLVLDVLDTHVGLTLIAAQAHAVPALRAQVGAVSARIGRTGLRLMRCHVRHVPGFTPPTQATQPTGLAEHELPLALFRAGAEALEALRGGVGPVATGAS